MDKHAASSFKRTWTVATLFSPLYIPPPAYSFNININNKNKQSPSKKFLCQVFFFHLKMSSTGAQTVAVAPKCTTAIGDDKKCNTDQNVAPQKQQHVEGAQLGGVRAENSACKCAPNCNCNPCNCK
ncbi:hypothetical protein Dsin_006240 [Dipteronia sinensis]|uniref:Metallothionein n=1 Tax=Dipteronia sinensis TaxID=43782 RepID=A0AAE0AY10_9ROSI|nr:hypothetical protein Dsin_006240 [Dipteronia sinensis]